MVAEEIAAEAFTKIWRLHQRFDSPEGIRAYLYQIVRNDCLKWLQKEKKAKWHWSNLLYLQSADQEKDHFHYLVNAETTRLLRAAIELLPPECSKVFRLLYVEGKSVNETALELEVSTSTVKTQKARGLRTLREHLKAHPLLLALITLLGYFGLP